MQIGIKPHVQASGDLDFKLDFKVIKSTFSETLESNLKSVSTWRSFKVKELFLRVVLGFLRSTVKFSYRRLGKNW